MAGRGGRRVRDRRKPTAGILSCKQSAVRLAHLGHGGAYMQGNGEVIRML
jgi:hypothetical protein